MPLNLLGLPIPPDPPHPTHVHPSHPPGLHQPPGGYRVLRDPRVEQAQAARELEIFQSRRYLTVTASVLSLAVGTALSFKAFTGVFGTSFHVKVWGDVFFLVLLGWWIAMVSLFVMSALMAIPSGIVFAAVGSIWRLFKSNSPALTSLEFTYAWSAGALGVVLAGVVWLVRALFF